MKKVITLGAVAFALIISHAALAAKPRIGVAEFNNRATGTFWWSGGVGDELADMVSNELSNTDEFRVVERAKLSPILREQDLAADGRVSEATGAKIGELTGAQYLVLGSVSAFESDVNSSGAGISIGGISIGGNKKSAYIAVDLRVVETTTGEIAYSRTVEGRSTSKGIKLGVWRSGVGGSLANEKKTPTGKAIRAVIVEIVDYLTCEMVYQDDCQDEYKAKEKKRKSKLKSLIQLD